MVKTGQNRARRPGGIRPACPMHAVRLCGTAPGKKATGGAFCRREKRRPEREARAAGGLFALQPAVLPAAWCAPVPPPALYGHTLCAPVLLSPACAPVLPPVLLTRRLPCVGISPERPHRGRPARPHMPCAPVAAHMFCRGRALCRTRRALRRRAVFVILNTLHARGTKRAAERARPCPERARRAAARKKGETL